MSARKGAVLAIFLLAVALPVPAQMIDSVAYGAAFEYSSTTLSFVSGTGGQWSVTRDANRVLIDIPPSLFRAAPVCTVTPSKRGVMGAVVQIRRNTVAVLLTRRGTFRVRPVTSDFSLICVGLPVPTYTGSVLIAGLVAPQDVVVDANGDVWVSECETCRLPALPNPVDKMLRYDSSGNLLSAMPTGTTGTQGLVTEPAAVGVHPYSTFTQGFVRWFDNTGSPLDLIGGQIDPNFNDGSSGNLFHNPRGMTLLSEASHRALWVADGGWSRVHRFLIGGISCPADTLRLDLGVLTPPPSSHVCWQYFGKGEGDPPGLTNPLSASARRGTALGEFNEPVDVSSYREPGQTPIVYVADWGNSRVQRLEGGTWSEWVSALPVSGVATDANGYVYVTDRAATEFHLLDPEGNWLMTQPQHGQNDRGFKLRGIAVDADCNVLVADTARQGSAGTARILRFEPSVKIC